MRLHSCYAQKPVEIHQRIFPPPLFSARAKYLWLARLLQTLSTDWYACANNVRRYDSITCMRRRFFMNMLIRIVPFTFTFHFFLTLFCSREVSSTSFCVVEKTLYLLYPFSGVHLGTRSLESRGQVLRDVYIVLINFWPLRSQSWECYKVYILLRIEYLLLLGDNSTIFH